MAIRSTASVATAVKRRGANALSVDAFIWLQENSGEVKKVTKLLDKHGETARAAERKAAEAEASASSRLEEAAKAEAAHLVHMAEFEKSATEVMAKQQAATELLNRRLKAADEKNGAADRHLAAMGEREEKLSARERNSETEVRAREEALEAREEAADGRERAQLSLAADLKKRSVTIETAAKMLKQAAASLR